MSSTASGYPVPEREQERQEALARYEILDTPPEQSLDDLTALAAQICGTPIALVTIIDGERQWFKSRVGLGGDEVPRAEAFCSHTILDTDEIMVVEDAHRDPRFAENRFVTGDPYIRFYAGAPLVSPDGHGLGALCVIDREPRQLSTSQREALRILARQAQSQLELRRISRELQRNNEALRREMAERRRRQREQARLAAIIESSNDAIISVGLDGTVQSWNPGAERIYGYTADEMIGRRIHVVAPEDRHEELGHLLAQVAAGAHAVKAETVRRRKNGTRFDAAVSASPILEDGAVTAISWIDRDITESKAAIRDMNAAMAMQESAIGELRRANEIKTSFVSVVGHEFRTPLTVIQGFSQMLATEEFSPAEIREYAQDIFEESNRLTRLITDMLDLDRMESGHMSLNVVEVSLNDIAAEVAERSVANAPLHRLDLQLAPGVPPLEADPDRLRQVLANLLSNAIKYSPDGGTITVATRHDEGSVHLVVSDEGLGIEAEALERIFDRYQRAGTPRDREISGTGLGLPIARQIVELHGGRLWVTSGPGPGAAFHVQLPLHASERHSGDA
jgi:PAS domain S-box-containing protein